MAVLAALAIALAEMVAAVMESTVPPSLVTAMPSVWPTKLARKSSSTIFAPRPEVSEWEMTARAGDAVVGGDAEGGGDGALRAGEGQLHDPALVARLGDRVHGLEGSLS